MKKLITAFVLLTIIFNNSFAQTFTTDVTINSAVPSGHGGGYNALWFPNNSAVMPENSSSYAGIMLTANVIRSSANSNWAFANSSSPAWKLYMGYGSTTDFFTITRSAPTTYLEQTLFKISNTGNIGVGTSTPGAALTVINHTPVIQVFDLDANPYDGSSEGKIAFGSSFGEFASIEAIRTGTDADDITQIRFSTSFATGAGGDGDNIERMRLTPQGNLLINKTSQPVNSSYKLDVAGSVRANAITVNTNGADFVFEPKYHLTPLSELNIYLNKNHHLPEIASAKEMQAEGLNLGENQIKLLQKVEELTLYLIEKDKEEEKQSLLYKIQQREMFRMKNKIKRLSKEVNKIKNL